MQLHRLHKYLTYAHTAFTKAFEIRYPALKEVGTPYAQLLPWQHTLYFSVSFIRNIRNVCFFDYVTGWKQFDSLVRTCNILRFLMFLKF